MAQLRRTLVSLGEGDAWDVSVDGLWCRATPRECRLRAQGWKLHVSTTLPTVRTLLAQTLPVLVRSGCAFKFAATLADVAWLNSGHAPRPGAGKFLTVYPDRDEDLPDLAAWLHRATDVLPGPRILSDRRYANGSSVHYRYGAFAGLRVLSNDGLYREVIRDPDGALVEDRREARFVAPEWAPSPFPPAQARAAGSAEAGAGTSAEAGGEASADTGTGTSAGAGTGTGDAPGLRRRRAAGVLLDDRFAVREAIRHANKGGVYRALDTGSATEVVIKEARPHVAVTPAGTDARDTLRGEARLLEVLAPLGVTPSLVALFEQNQHLFLAEQSVPGTPLRRWVLDRVRRLGMGPHLADAVGIAGRLAPLMETAHRAGLVLRDFNPNNLMLLDSGELRLLDLELAAAPTGTAGSSPAQSAPAQSAPAQSAPAQPAPAQSSQAEEYVVGGTPGYGAPEQLAGAAPAVTADYFSLGATICFVLTGVDPWFPEEYPNARPLRERIGAWLSAGSAAGALPETLTMLVTGLMDDEPACRWTPAQAGSVLNAAERDQAHGGGQGGYEQGLSDQPPGGQPPTGSVAASAGSSAARLGTLTDGEWGGAVAGMLGHLLATMDPSDPERLWPAPSGGSVNDPCNVQHGAAGVAGVLARCYELTGDERLPEVLATACTWIERRLRTESESPAGTEPAAESKQPAESEFSAGAGLLAGTERLGATRPPGLYFGSAGIAWALHGAGRVLGSRELRQRACGLAKSLPSVWPNPDLTHGTAGLGLASLRLWQATGDGEFAGRACQAAEALLGSSGESAAGTVWETPASFDSVFAGERFYGFAHGNAGIGYFLLALAAGTSRRDCLVGAGEAAETLLATAVGTGGTGGGARWGQSPGQEDMPLPYWCTGSSGVGTFLIRLAQATGDDRMRKAAEMAARAVMDHSWAGPPGQCHGLAGDAEFLLDVAEALGEPRYEAWARDLASVIFARRFHRDGRMVFPDDEGGVSAEWAGGLSGILALFLRLRYGGPRMWMADPPSWELRV